MAVQGGGGGAGGRGPLGYGGMPPASPAPHHRRRPSEPSMRDIALQMVQVSKALFTELDKLELPKEEGEGGEDE